MSRVCCTLLIAVMMLCSFVPVMAGTGKITGTVLDQNGAAVAHITVRANPIGMAWSGGIPQGKTDDSGHFSITVINGRDAEGTMYGQHWSVYPFDRSGYYPDLSSAFYATPENSPQRVEITPEAPVAIIEIRLGQKSGALISHVTDAASGETLHPEFDLSWASGEPNKRMGIRTADNPFRVQIPANVDVKLVVQCENHKPWTYPGVLNLQPGKDLVLDIKMQPAPASTFGR